MTHDYSKALEDFEGVPSGIPDEGFGRMWIDGDIKPETYKAIQSALRIAERLRKGEVSEGICEAGVNALKGRPWTQMTGVEQRKEEFKAMAAKLLEEVENE